MPLSVSIAELNGGPYDGPGKIALEAQLRAATIRRLAVALDDQRRQLDSRMSAALEVLALAANSELPLATRRTTATNGLAEVPGIAVRCLGSLHVQAGTIGLTRWRSGKARALFEYLVTHRDLITRATGSSKCFGQTLTQPRPAPR